MPADVKFTDLTDTDRARVEAWLADFEHSWNPERLAAQVGQLPPAGSPVRAAALVRLVTVDLKRQWRQGRPVIIESYLERYPELADRGSVPVDLIQAEYEARRESGSATASWSDVARRFPGRAAEPPRPRGRWTRPIRTRRASRRARPPRNRSRRPSAPWGKNSAGIASSSDWARAAWGPSTWRATPSSTAWSR